MRHCRRCLLPATVPGADLDRTGTCAFCRAPRDDAGAEAARAKRASELETLLGALRLRPGPHAVVCLSGGKDSIYLLHRLRVEYGLDVIAFTSDMNIPDVAWENIRRTIDKLGVEHVVHRPDRDFYRRMYRFLLQNQEERGAVRTVCYVCAPLFEGEALKLAVRRGAPFVFAGYGPGQPDPARMMFEFSREMICERDWTPPELRESGLFSAADLDHFWNPAVYPAGTVFPRYVAPFHAWEYSQEATIKAVVELGLVASSRNASPIHSNCPLNWLLMYSDLETLGYNPYAPEFASLIRDGKANRLYWRIMQPVVNFMIRRRILLGRNVTESFKWLELGPADLRVNRPSTPAE
jgi:hypothetical protein